MSYKKLSEEDLRLRMHETDLIKQEKWYLFYDRINDCYNFHPEIVQAFLENNGYLLWLYRNAGRHQPGNIQITITDNIRTVLLQAPPLFPDIDTQESMSINSQDSGWDSPPPMTDRDQDDFHDEWTNYF